MGDEPLGDRYRNAIRPGQELPNGQLASPWYSVGGNFGGSERCLENHPRAGIACAMKNAGVGVGLPDWGRCRLTVEEGRLKIRSGASCIGQGLGTVLVQIACETLGISNQCIDYVPAETNLAPDFPEPRLVPDRHW